MTSIKLSYLKESVIPLLQEKHKTADALKKAIGAFLKQGDEEQIPVVNENGEPVEIEEIILVGATPAEEAPAEEAPPAEMELSIQSAVDKALKNSEILKAASQKVQRPFMSQSNKVWATPLQRRSKVFKGEHGDYKAYGFGQFLLYSAFGDKTAKAWLDKEGINCVRNKVQTEGVASAGGVLVPAEFSTDIIRLVEEYGIFRQNANVMPMSSDVMTVPRVVSEGAASWYGEGTTIAAADDVYDNIELVAKKMGRITRVSRELMQDAAISMADRIATSMAQKFAQAEDDAAFNGTGAQAYGGVHGLTEKLKDGNHGAGLTAATANDDQFTEVIIGDLYLTMATLPTYALPNAQWFISQNGFINCFQRLTQAAGGTNRIQMEDGARLMFEGYPVVITNSMYNSNTALDNEVFALFGDMSMAATLGDRNQLEITTSEHAYFTTDEVGIRGTQRVAINVHDIGDGTTAGPIVGIQFTA